MTAGIGELGTLADADKIGGVLGKGARFLNGGSFGSALARGALSSAVTQGVATATGLQGSFSWAGVAAASVAAGAGNAVGGDLPGLEGKGLSASNIASHTGVGAASLIASAATRSAITGSSFGRAVEAGLPDVIGQVIGGAVGSRLADGPSRPIQSGGSGRVIDGSGKIPGLTFVPEALEPSGSSSSLVAS